VVRTLLASTVLLCAVAPAAAESVEEGRQLVGTTCPEWSPERWLQGGPLRLADLEGKVVLLRFFTSTECPFCAATAPALNELEREFREKGLMVVGMYTPKPHPRPVADEEVRRAVDAYGFRFPVAVDGSWGTLRALWLDRVPQAGFTSASLLIDREGVVRHVQRGGAYAADSEDATARADYRAMRDAIVRWTGGR
jgi:peroxiredoxin